jgi:hypothetical protein
MGTLIFLLLIVLVRASFCTFNVADIYALLGSEQIVGIDRWLFCRSTVGSFTDQPSVRSSVTENTIE